MLNIMKFRPRDKLKALEGSIMAELGCPPSTGYSVSMSESYMAELHLIGSLYYCINLI